jgi:hypothetical protein
MRPPVSPPPTTTDEPSSTSSTKRPHSPAALAQSTENGEEVKRRRLSTDQARGKRMFGALMGTLTSFQKQSSRDSKSVFERRAEIDARVKEKVAKEKVELLAERERMDKERKEQEEQLKTKLETETVLIYVSFELC